MKGEEEFAMKVTYRFASLALVLLVACGIATLSAPTVAAEEGALDKILKTKEFNIGFVVLPPSVFKDPKTNEPTGYYVDAARFIAEQMGVKPIFHEESWATFISGLQAGRYDLSIAATVNTIPRALAVAFTEPLAYAGTCLIVAKNSPYKTLADLTKPKVKIGVIQGAFMVPWAKQTFAGGEILESTASAFVEPMDVISGRVDASVTDAQTCRKFASQRPEVRTLYADDPLNITATGWMVRRDDLVLLNFMNSAIRYIRSTGKLREFVEKYDTQQLQEKKTWEIWGKE
jgi:polar amino acid transport system substrate-binding protein